jgi:hypothetical protein
MDNHVLLRIGWGEAARMVLWLWAVVLAVLVFQVVRTSGGPTPWSEIAGGTTAAVIFSTGFAWTLREAYRVRICEGGLSMGWSQRIVPWKEINSVSEERMPLGTRGLAVRSTNHPTVAVPNSIASSTAFREALKNWCPEGHPLRETVIASARDPLPG